jgi:hypothetical protein
MKRLIRVSVAVATILLLITSIVGWVWGYLFAHGSNPLQAIAFLHFLPGMAARDFFEEPSLFLLAHVLVLLLVEFAYFFALSFACLKALRLPRTSDAAL